MKWLNILFTVLSSANMIGDIVRNNKFENKSKKLDRKIDEYEREIIERIDNKMKQQFVYINNQINELYSQVNLLTNLINKIVNTLAWWIPTKKLRNNFRNKFKIAEQ